MKRKFLTILMMASAIVFVFSSCQKDKVEKSGNSGTSQETPFNPNIIENAVTDIDGNTYKAVKIGDQVWMAENLRTTRYADNTSIPMGSTRSYDVAYRYCPNNDASNVTTYGYLYNWKAVMHNSSSSGSNPSGVQGICPNGWHVPSSDEWGQLVYVLQSQSQYVCCDEEQGVAKALASTTGWKSSYVTCDVGNNPSSNNATGFNALPAGLYRGDDISRFGEYACFWTATQSSGFDRQAGKYCLYYDSNWHGDYPDDKDLGMSVRCVRD